MEDRFKFRVWNKVHKKMYPSTKDVNLAISLETMLEEKHLVVMQCTGLKDKNGKLIYEGDIIKVPDDYDEFGMMACEIREVWFKDGGFRLKPKDEFQLKKGARGHWLEDNNTYKVLGNIWQNPELLESNNND